MDIEVFRSFDFSGRPNEYDGIVFSVRQSGIHWVVDFLVREIQDGSMPTIRITMEPDNHNMPHIHLNRQHSHHFASISLNGVFIHGENELNRKEKDTILNWVNSHSVTLRELWDCVKAGRPDYQALVKKVNNTWEYEGIVFEGQQPSHQVIIDDIIVWYDGDFSRTEKKELTVVHCTGRMFVIAPTNDELFSGIGSLSLMLIPFK